jgi:hypothetical protein
LLLDTLTALCCISPPTELVSYGVTEVNVAPDMGKEREAELLFELMATITYFPLPLYAVT